MNKNKLFKLSTIVFLCVMLFTTSSLAECNFFLAGKKATTDGSVMVGISNEAGNMGYFEIVPAMTFLPGTEVDMLSVRPYVTEFDAWVKQHQRGYNVVGKLPMPEETFRAVLMKHRLQGRTLTGMNEHGVVTGLVYIPMKPELGNALGKVAPGGCNHWTTSSTANALMRCKTAREAVQFVGWMLEEYGFSYYLAPEAGAGMVWADENEAWIMEVYGPGFDWTPDSGKPGVVWAAQRVPDDEVTVNSNLPTIGEIDLDDPDHFMASSNVYSLAEEMGFWKPGEPFVWHKVYSVRPTGGPHGSMLREWRYRDLLAPSLKLEYTGDPNDFDTYPWSIKPDNPITPQKVIDIMRTSYVGTEYDITEIPAFQVDGEKSPLVGPATATDSVDLLKLLGIEKDVEGWYGLSNSFQTHTCVVQIRDWLTDPVSLVMWYAAGPANTSVFTPIYGAGLTMLPDTYTSIPDWTRINRNQNAWNFQLVHSLSSIKYQKAIKDIKGVFEPAEATFFAMQPEFEKIAVEIYEQKGEDAAEEFVTKYTNFMLQQTYRAYNELVDVLMYKYLYKYASTTYEPELPQIVPSIFNGIELFK